MNEDETYLSIKEQIERLRLKGLLIEDEIKAASILQETSYSTLVGYYSIFFYSDRISKQFISGTTLDEVYSLYQFNHDLCALYLTYILAAERKLKTIIADCFADAHSPTAYWDSKSFSYSAIHNKDKNEDDQTYDVEAKSVTRYSRLKEKIEVEIERKYRDPALYKGTPFETYKNRTNEIPIWLLVSTFSLGLLRDFYNSMQEKEKHIICNRLKIQYKEFESGLALLNSFRNRCAHMDRVIDFYHTRDIKVVNGKNTIGTYYGVYGVTYFLKQLLPSSDFMEFFSALNNCFDNLAAKLHSISLSEIKEKGMRFPSDNNVILSEMGTYLKGVILTDDEFNSLLQMYIIPMIPCGDCTTALLNTAVEKRNSGLTLYNEDNSELLFSQSSESGYTVKVHVPKEVCTKELQNSLEAHLKNLIHYLQIVWNSNKATNILKPKEMTFLFETNSEIAYQLALCHYLCFPDTNLFQEKQVIKNELAEIEKIFIKAQTEKSQSSIEKTKNKRKTKLDELNIINRKISEYGYHCTRRRETLYSIISCFDQWAIKTYEGKHMPFGIVINDELDNGGKFDYIQFLKQDYSATISDGLYSCVEIQADGFYKQHIQTNAGGESLDTIPYPHQGFAQQCDKGKIGVVLTDVGDIIIIKDKKMICSKHNGHWTYNNHEYAIKKILSYLTSVPEAERDPAARTIYRTLIDVSYSHGGACIAITNDANNPTLLKMAYPTLLNESDKQLVKDSIGLDERNQLSDEELHNTPQSEFRLSALKGFVGDFTIYHKLDPFLRRELIEMDGALILGPSGEIHAVASIINPNGASAYSGGRTTAAIRLSIHGMGIKVSQDGYIKFYENGMETLSI